MRRPLLAFALAWMIGSLMARTGPPADASLLLLILPILLLAGWARHDPSFREPALWILALFAFFFLGQARTGGVGRSYETNLRSIEAVAQFNPVEVEGVVRNPPEPRGDYWWIPIDLAAWEGSRGEEPVRGLLDLWIRSDSAPDLKSGDIATLIGNLRPYSREVGRKQDGIANWHETRGAVGSLFLSDMGALSASNGSTTLLNRIFQTRDRWKADYREWAVMNLSPQGAGLLLAMTVGDRTGLDPNQRAGLTRTGLLHLTAISGLHVTAMILTLPWGLKLFGVKKQGRAAIALFFALFLLFLVGNRPSVLRAVVMGICLLLGVLLDRSRDSLNFLGGATLINLMISPHDLFSPGFQFSYLVAASLLLWGPSLEGFTGAVDRFTEGLRILPPTGAGYVVATRGVGWLAAGIWTSIIAAVAAAPISLYHFHQAALGSLFGNLVGVPLTVLLTTVGMVAALGGWTLPLVSGLLAGVLDFVGDLLVLWVVWVDGWGWGFYRVSGFHPVQVLIPIAVILLVRQEQNWLRPTLLSRRSLCLLLLFVLALLPYAPAERSFRATFLDVGQGDSILLEFPAGEKILVDGGPPRRVSPGGVSPLGALLLSRGVQSLDGVFITHPEADHFGGFAALIDEIPIKTFYCSGDVNPSQQFADFAVALEGRGIPVERVLHGDALSGIRDATVTVLAPFHSDLVYGWGDKNERSVVLLVETKGLRTLLPGDIGEPQERRLIEAGLVGEVDLLKVPHHGSRYSTTREFLQTLRPSAAVIQCGVNPHGHPAPEVIERLQEAGIPVFVTLFDGSVTAHWDGKKLLIETGE